MAFPGFQDFLLSFPLVPPARPPRKTKAYSVPGVYTFNLLMSKGFLIWLENSTGWKVIRWYKTNKNTLGARCKSVGHETRYAGGKILISRQPTGATNQRSGSR